MAPFRPSARTNRSGRLQADNDVFEGLPVRQWRRTEGTFGLPPPAEIEQDNDCPFPELPLPRETSLLLPHTQQLLREARKPRFAKRKAERPEEDKGDEEDETEAEVLKGWQTKKWSQIPRENELPDREYLAKRRKGLPSLAVTEPTPAVPQVPTRTAKVRKLDDAGNSTIYEVIAPVGQTIAGEVVDEDVSMSDAPTLAPGTVVEGIGVANAEGQVIAHDLLQTPSMKARRRPPPPKRKGGPGRGKKKVMFQSSAATTEDAATNSAANGAVPSADGTIVAVSASEKDLGVEEGQAEGDEDEGEDGEEGEEGEIDEDDEDREDGEVSDAEKVSVLQSTLPSADASTVEPADQSLLEPPTITPAIDSAAPSDLPMPDAETTIAAAAEPALSPQPDPESAPEVVAEDVAPPTDIAAPQPLAPPTLLQPPIGCDPSSSLEQPLAKDSGSRQGSLTETLPPANLAGNEPAPEVLEDKVESLPAEQPSVEPDIVAEARSDTVVGPELAEEPIAAGLQPAAEDSTKEQPVQEESLLDQFERDLQKED